MNVIAQILDKHHIFCFDFFFCFGSSLSGGFFSVDGEDYGQGDEKEADDVHASDRVAEDGNG